MDEQPIIAMGRRRPADLLLQQAEIFVAHVQEHQHELALVGLSADDMEALWQKIQWVTTWDNKQEELRDRLRQSTQELAGHRAQLTRWRARLKAAALLAFEASAPDLLQPFRVQRFARQSISHVLQGMEALLAAGEAHQASLALHGITPQFLGEGHALLDGIRQRMAAQTATSEELASATQRLNHAKGELYLQLRYLSRLGKLAFIDDERRADLFRLPTQLTSPGSNRSGRGEAAEVEPQGESTSLPSG